MTTHFYEALSLHDKKFSLKWQGIQETQSTNQERSIQFIERISWGRRKKKSYISVTF